jgi:hypothetical protein
MNKKAINPGFPGLPVRAAFGPIPSWNLSCQKSWSTWSTWIYLKALNQTTTHEPKINFYFLIL